MRRLAFATLALTAAWAAVPARACAPAMPVGTSVTVASEEALIVFDQARGIEHFIRRADFRTDAAEFGFLVPTPSAPELSEVDGDVFSRLRTVIEPPVVHEDSWVPLTCCTAAFFLTAAGAEVEAVAGAAGGVQVLSTARVAGLDATVLRASDADALGIWLGEHGYENRPALIRWLSPYVDDGFAITAFRFVKSDPSSTAIGSRAVRMSFETDRPFYPYREPSDHPAEPGRTLRVHVVGPARADAKLVAAEGWPSAELEFAAPLEDAASVLGDSRGELTGTLWLSSYLDSATVRSNADLGFDVQEGEEVRPAPVVLPGRERILPLPVEPAVLLGAGIWWWRRRKKKVSGSGARDA